MTQQLFQSAMSTSYPELIIPLHESPAPRPGETVWQHDASRWGRRAAPSVWAKGTRVSKLSLSTFQRSLPSILSLVECKDVEYGFHRGGLPAKDKSHAGKTGKFTLDEPLKTGPQCTGTREPIQTSFKVPFHSKAHESSQGTLQSVRDLSSTILGCWLHLQMAGLEFCPCVSLCAQMSLPHETCPSERMQFKAPFTPKANNSYSSQGLQSSPIPGSSPHLELGGGRGKCPLSGPPLQPTVPRTVRAAKSSKAWSLLDRGQEAGIGEPLDGVYTLLALVS